MNDDINLYEGQPKEFLRLKDEAIGLGDKAVSIETELQKQIDEVHALADRKLKEADKLFDWDQYWQMTLKKYPHLVVVKPKNGGDTCILRIKEYEASREEWDAKAEIVGYGR